MSNELFALLILVALVLSLGGPRIWRYWERRSSSGWPTAPASFVEGKIGWRASGKGQRYPQVETSFSYEVSGNRFGGYYEEVFLKLEEAQDILESLKTGPLFVRFDPRNPVKYFMDPYRNVA
jgi:hypothetical protein